MTELSIKNLVGVWKRISESDFGRWISDPASKYYRFFSKMFESGDSDCRHINITEEIAPMLRGYHATNKTFQEDFNLCVCLDISHVSMSDYGLEEFHWWLLTTKPYPGCEHNFMWYLQELISKENQNKSE